MLHRPRLSEVSKYLGSDLQDQLVAIDLETKGTNAADPSQFIAGVGFAHSEGCFYIHLADASDEVRRYVREWLLGAQRLTSFNVLFDGTFLQVFTGRWLNWTHCSFGLFKQMTTEGYTNQRWDLETAQREVLGWEQSNKLDLQDALKRENLGKGDMWRLPVDILGRYCALDAEAHFQLHEELLLQCQSPELLEYHTRLYMTEVRLLAQQQLRGNMIEQEKLLTCHADLLEQISLAKSAFESHPDVAPHVAAAQERARDAWMASRPSRWTSKMVQSKAYEKWLAREQQVIEAGSFNPNSKPQLIKLFYGDLGFKPLKFTERGTPIIDRHVLPTLGEPGKLLVKMNTLVKRRGYVERVIERSAGTGIIHAQFKSVGTVSGRLGGSGNLNLQQMPKDKSFLESFKARPGHVLVQLDFVAIEPVLLAEFSQDKSLLKLYGPGAPANDIYLFTAAQIPGLGDEILKYYDPNNPTSEGIAAAKKHCKQDRAISKTVCLASNYGASAPKIHEVLKLGGIDISLKKVRDIHAEYWRLYRGVKRFEEMLQDMWLRNGGWIPTALGRPIAIADSLIRDALNRMIQTSAHDILQLFIWNIDRLRQERELPWHPWLIDLHDECIVEVEEQYAEEVAQSFRDAMVAVNAELEMGIQLKGDPQIAHTLADIKIEG